MAPPIPSRAGDQPVPSREVLDERYGWHASRGAIDRVLHHTHWIPDTRGFTSRFLDTTWPGWSLARLIAVFDAAGIRLRSESGRASAPHGGHCDWRVRELHFNSAKDLFVEWNDLTVDDGKFLCHSHDAPRITAWFAVPVVRPRTHEGPRPVDLSGETFIDD
ncbi:MAG: hypothetical protein ACKOCC_03235 [Actinomycetota bacterium]